MPVAVESVTLRNPRVIHTLIRETHEGAGRSATETADNLILEAAEQRRVMRERTARVSTDETNSAPIAPKASSAA